MRAPLLAVMCLFSCDSPTVRYNGIEIGGDLGTLQALHPDVTAGALAAADVPGMPPIDGLEQYSRQPHDRITESYYFEDGRLKAAVAIIDDPALVPQVVEILEQENGRPHQAHSALGTGIQRWTGGNADLMVFSSKKDKTFVILKRSEEPSNDGLLLSLLVLLNLFAIGNLLHAKPGMESFLNSVQGIDSPQRLEAFKAVAARSMYGALFQIGALLGATGLFFYGYANDLLTFSALVIHVLMGLIVIKLGLNLKKVETRVQGAVVAPEYQNEVQSIINTWKKKPLPNW